MPAADTRTQNEVDDLWRKWRALAKDAVTPADRRLANNARRKFCRLDDLVNGPLKMRTVWMAPATAQWEQISRTGFLNKSAWPLVAGVSRRREGHQRQTIEWHWHVSRGYDFIRGGYENTKRDAMKVAERVLRQLAPNFAPEEA